MIIVLTHDDFNKATEEVRQLEEVLDVDLKYLKHLKNIFQKVHGEYIKERVIGMLQFELPEQFEEQLNGSLQQLYKEAIQQARFDASITKEWLSYKVIMETLGISRTTIDKWVSEGLPLYKIGQINFINRDELNDFIRKHKK